jgi:hypothetical protein
MKVSDLTKFGPEGVKKFCPFFATIEKSAKFGPVPTNRQAYVLTDSASFSKRVAEIPTADRLGFVESNRQQNV